MKKTLLSVIAVLIAFVAFSQPVPRQKVVFEIGTGTWCVYCPGAAMGAADLISNRHDVAIIKYHSGDSYANTYSSARLSYYGISSYPTTKIDGILTHVGGNANNSIYPAYLNYYNQRINVPSPFTVAIYGENTGGLNYDAQVVINKMDTYTASNLVLHFAVTETNIPQTWFNQTHVKDVLRLMAPNQNGTPLDFSATDEIVVDLSFTLNASWVASNMSVIAFVQDVPTKTIFQAYVIELGDLQPASINSSFIASNTEICEGEDVQFTCQSSGNITSWLWTFPGGDPETSTEENPLVIYNTPGVYGVTLEVSNAEETSTTTMDDFIHVDEMPDTPNIPVGDIIVDLYYVTTSEYTVAEITGAEEYSWSLMPLTAGSAEGTANACTVTWNTAFTGQAIISVKAISGACESDYSEELEVTVTNTVGVEDALTMNQFSVSPNPGNGLFVVQLPAIAKGKILNARVYNINGRIVWEDKLRQENTQQLTINLSHLSQGIYYLSLESGTVSLSKSISIMK
ncbi:MAG: PKD domain-containing protein [Bacteroidales bacterium]|nr:PKD domain-containing protein [Bacteroidales bacterium]